MRSQVDSDIIKTLCDVNVCYVCDEIFCRFYVKWLNKFQSQPMASVQTEPSFHKRPRRRTILPKVVLATIEEEPEQTEKLKHIQKAWTIARKRHHAGLGTSCTEDITDSL